LSADAFAQGESNLFVNVGLHRGGEFERNGEAEADRRVGCASVDTTVDVDGEACSGGVCDGGASFEKFMLHGAVTHGVVVCFYSANTKLILRWLKVQPGHAVPLRARVHGRDPTQRDG